MQIVDKYVHIPVWGYTRADSVTPLLGDLQVEEVISFPVTTEVGVFTLALQNW